jgi:hypothetical protein
MILLNFYRTGCRPVCETSDFRSLIRRVRAGDQDAAAELVRDYESHVRRAARMNMRDARLRRSFDSTDISQSVLASFFVRAALGQYELDRPDQLVRLLAGMARNKLATVARKAAVTLRDDRDVQTIPCDHARAAHRAPDLCEGLVGRDLIEEVRNRLTEEERRLSDQRVDGRDWAAIAEDLGGRPDALRMKLTRALKRVAQELGLDVPGGP